MKRAALILFIVCLMSFFLAAQTTCVISARMNNFMYAGLENPLSIAVPDYPCASLYVTTDNGTLKGDGCEYVTIPKNGNSATVYANVIENGDTIEKGSWQFRVFKVPDPTPTIAGRSNQRPEIPLNLLLALPILQTKMERFDIDVHFIVKSYDMTVETINLKPLTFHSENSHFTEEMKEALKTLSEGAIVRFSNIVVDGPDGTTRTIEDLVLKIE
jgi:hypothetical protein